MTTHWPDGTPKSTCNAFSGPALRAAQAPAPEPVRTYANGKRAHRRTTPTPAQSISLPGSYAPLKRA